MQQVIFESVSNREQWSDTVEVRRDGTLVDLSAATIVLAVRSKQSKSILMTAQTSDSTITIESLGVFVFTFLVSRMRELDASIAYEVGCTLEIGGVVEQLFIGNISVLDGIVA
jgi:hypothetical protein